ncbi:hypothetical protein BV898_19918, partial [Hypsibius exemplaris]
VSCKRSFAPPKCGWNVPELQKRLPSVSYMAKLPFSCMTTDRGLLLVPDVALDQMDLLSQRR